MEYWVEALEARSAEKIIVPHPRMRVNIRTQMCSSRRDETRVARHEVPGNG